MPVTNSRKFPSTFIGFHPFCRAYETLSDSLKKDAYDQQMGFGRSTFQDMHFSGAARGRGVYSDDEYESMNKTDKRTKPKGGANDQKWKYDETAGERFW